MDENKEIRLAPGPGGPDMRTGSIFFIGNATVLIRYAGLTILTDPTFVHMHESVSIGYGMHTTRMTNPAIDIGDLPRLDLILLSHFHGDHFDQVAQRDLDKGLPIVTTPEAAKELSERKFRNTHALRTWETLTVSRHANLRITALPGRHGPPVANFVLPEVMGSLLEFQTLDDLPLFRLYITGDTLVYDDLKEIPKRYPEIDIGLLHLGGTRVMGILVTMDAKQGVEAIRIINPRLAIPIHFNDYDVFTSTLADFRTAVESAGMQDRVHYLSHGETFTFEVPRTRLLRAA